MTDHPMKPEDRALIERIAPYLLDYPTDSIATDLLGRLFDAARAEGRRSPGVRPSPECPTCGGAGPCPHSPDMLGWLAEHRSLELDYGFDAEEEDTFWRVHERSGNVNDREWDLIGQGATPLAALLSAKSFIESTNSEAGHD